MPSRKRGWSSAIRMRVFMAGPVGRFFTSQDAFGEAGQSSALRHRNKTLDLGAAIGAGLDRQDAPNDVSAILHNTLAHSPPTRRIDPKAATIVLDSKSKMSGIRRQSYFDPAGFSMFDRVVDSFLGDSIEMQADGLAHRQYGPVTAQ